METSADQLQPPRQSLPVLANSATEEQLKQELERQGPAPIGHALHRSTAGLSPQQRALEAMVVETIRSIYDPEIPVNIYDLGLIYAIEIDAENRVKVQMTLTAPGCPVAGSLPAAVERRIEAIPQVASAEVELVWDPPWDKSRMSESALLDLGLF